MKPTLKRLCAAALILALFASLAACSAPASQNAPQSGASSGGNSSDSTSGSGTGETPAMVFQATYAALPEGIDYLNRPQVYDGRIWSLTSTD